MPITLNGYLQVFSINAATGVPTLAQTVNLNSIAATGITIHPNGKFLFATDGLNVYSYSIAANGQLTQVTQVSTLGTNLLLNTAGTVLYIFTSVAGAGGSNGRIDAYAVNQTTGALTVINDILLYRILGAVTNYLTLNSAQDTLFIANTNGDNAGNDVGSLYSIGSNGGVTFVQVGPRPLSLAQLLPDNQSDVVQPVAHPSLPFIYRCIGGSVQASNGGLVPAQFVVLMVMQMVAGVATVVQTLKVTGPAGAVPTVNGLTLDRTGASLYLASRWAASGNTDTFYEFAVAPGTGELTALNPASVTGSPTINATFNGSPGTTAYNAVLQQTFAALTPWHVVYRPCTNSKTDGTATTDQSSLLYFIDRNRTGYWSIFNYPAASAPGTSNPYFATVYPVDQNFYFGGGDGNVYCQPIRVADVNQAEGIFEVPQFTPDDFAQPVVSVYRSKLSEQGDALLQKQCKMWWGVGQSAPKSTSLLFRYLGTDGNFYTYSPSAGQNQTLPFEVAFNLQEAGEQGAVVNYFLMQTQITGSNMWMRAWGLVWRGVRYSGSSNVNP